MHPRSPALKARPRVPDRGLDQPHVLEHDRLEAALRQLLDDLRRGAEVLGRMPEISFSEGQKRIEKAAKATGSSAKR